MSIAITTLNYLTMMVLRGATLAGDNILDNPVNPFPENVISKPTIAVYVGTDTRDDVDEVGFFGAPHLVELSIQTFLPAEVVIRVGGNKIKLTSRGNGLQFVLGVLGAQIETALSMGESEAAQLWRELVAPGPKKIVTTPWLMEVKAEAGGIRVPAVERLMEVSTFADPLFRTDDIPPFWQRVLALFEADQEYAPVASLIRSLATGVGDLPVWREAQAQLGMTEQGVSAIGLAPVLGHNEFANDDASDLTEITLDPLGLTADDVLPG